MKRETVFFVSKHLMQGVDANGLPCLVLVPGRGNTYRNPFREVVKRLRRRGDYKSARAVAKHARDAEREVYLRERARLTEQAKGGTL